MGCSFFVWGIKRVTISRMMARMTDSGRRAPRVRLSPASVRKKAEAATESPEAAIRPVEVGRRHLNALST